MYFKISEGTATYDKLVALQQRIQECNNAAKAVADEQNATAYAGKRGVVGGGIGALCFDTKPDGYKLLQSPNYYYPKSIKANSALHDAIAALPTVSNKELAEIVGYKAGVTTVGDQMYFSERPGVTWGKGWIGIDTGRNQLVGNPDLVEILESEWFSLTAKPKPVTEPA